MTDKSMWAPRSWGEVTSSLDFWAKEVDKCPLDDKAWENFLHFEKKLRRMLKGRRRA